jgi:hypothetical protein
MLGKVFGAWFKKSRFWVTKGMVELSHFEVGKGLVVI